ncbi:hypothetical protein JCM10450v2_001057 [Rhodotorula kratochvilovae]
MQDLPSLYAHLQQPDAPPVNLAQAKPLAAHRDALKALARTVERGVAGSFLKTVLDESYAQTVTKRKYYARQKAQKAAKEGADDEAAQQDEAAELAEKGFVQKKRARDTSEAAETSGQAGAVLTKAQEMELARQRGVRRAKRIREELVQPDVELEEAELPEDFPSHDLLTSIHSHATTLLASKHHLVPRLMRSSPLLPPRAVAHFDSLARRVQEQEKYIERKGTKAQLRALKTTRIRGEGAGRRRWLWADADRAFEGTALVALGMLAQLLVQDAAALPGDLPLPPPAL